jgi:hypothetical protein
MSTNKPLGPLILSTSLEPRRTEFEKTIATALARISSFAAQHGWEEHVLEPFFDSVRVFDDKAAFDAFLIEATGVDKATKLPAEYCAALENRVLTAVSPAMYDAVYPDGREPGSYEKLLAHEIAHRLHIRILKGDEEAMGPVWFYEGFAIYAVDQMNDPTYMLSNEELWLIVENPKRGSYKKYGAVIRQFLKKTTIAEMVERAGKDGFGEWLQGL